jgi:predicted RecB family nuclease
MLESYMACHYKAYLKLTLAGDEHLLLDKPNLPLDGNSRLAPSSDTVREVHLRPVKTQDSVELTSCYLRKAVPLILGGVFETDRISVQIEGLQRVTGSSDIGGFHYLPLVFQTGTKDHETLNLLLDVYGFILSSLQGRSPAKGIIQKSTGESTTVHLSPAHKKGELIISALSETLCAEKPPILILNKHCKICEFQSRCHAQAVEEDNLSLLRGISESEIMRLRKNGIFTINQLSYTFRPRRVKKRSKTPARIHYFALQARALREKHIFIYGSPNLNAKDSRVYLDLEGTRPNGSYYLIGLLVDHAGETHQRSFWADGDDGEAQIFMEMLDYLKSYRDYSVLHYGAYEVRALRRMQKRLPEKYAREIEIMLKHAINVLAIIGPHIYFPVYSNSLKEIAGVLGHKWSAANASGAQAVLWKRRWDETQDPHIKRELVRYNMDDCIALKLVSSFIEQASQHLGTTSKPHTSLHTDDFEKDVKPRGRFQKQAFVLDEFDYIN